MVVSSIITLLLLAGAVELMQTNRREAVRSDTQRDVQAALDYISRDLREAIYVYDGDCLRPNGVKVLVEAIPGPPPRPAVLCPGLLRHLAGLNTVTNLPVLAFWRADPIPQPLLQNTCIPNAAPGSTLRGDLEAACSSRKMLTLVVYSLNWDNPNGIWQGRSRITRYELPQYTFGGGDQITAGWVSPLQSTFAQWPNDPATQNPLAIPPTNFPTRVLVDFVDNQTDQDNEDAAICPTLPPLVAGQTRGPNERGGFFVSPADQGAGPGLAAGVRRGFYACVRGADNANLNQEVLIRIRADAVGRAGLPIYGRLLLPMETRVMTRGVFGKG
jgi:hypothetical protein